MIGSDAVHPAILDLKDDIDPARQLFQTGQHHCGTDEKLSQSKRKAIQTRDEKKKG